MGDKERTKKSSRFDVPPTEVISSSLDQLLHTYLPPHQQNILPSIVYYAPAYQQATVHDQSHINPFMFQSVISSTHLDLPVYMSPSVVQQQEVLHPLADKLQLDPLLVYNIVTKLYKEKLQLKLQKNFDYIRRKDAGLITTDEAIKVAATHNHPVVSRPMIGADSISSGERSKMKSNNVSAQLLKSVDYCSILISNLPLDIEEDDLRILLARQGIINLIKMYTDFATGRTNGKALVLFARSDSVATSIYKFDNIDIDGCRIKVEKGNSKLVDDNLELIITPERAVTNKIEQTVSGNETIVNSIANVEVVNDDIDVDSFLHSLL